MNKASALILFAVLLLLSGCTTWGTTSASVNYDPETKAFSGTFTSGKEYDTFKMDLKPPDAAWEVHVEASKVQAFEGQKQAAELTGVIVEKAVEGAVKGLAISSGAGAASGALGLIGKVPTE